MEETQKFLLDYCLTNADDINIYLKCLANNFNRKISFHDDLTNRIIKDLSIEYFDENEYDIDGSDYLKNISPNLFYKNSNFEILRNTPQYCHDHHPKTILSNMYEKVFGKLLIHIN